jgi:hypothetical protein
MTLRNFVLVSSVIFALAALIHVLRILGQWDVIIDGRQMPMVVSYATVVVTGLLSFAGFRLVRQMRKYLT